MAAEEVIARARGLIGTPFRTHGRDPALGLDCVGLVALVFDRAADVPNDYALRNDQTERWIATVDRFAARRTGESPCAGDVFLLQAGPAQLHLGIWTGESLIHADARLRRIVETPGPPPWPVLARWHATNGES